MLIGMCEGKTVHEFRIRGKTYRVRRGRDFVAVWYKLPGIIVVLAPAGMSYHQAAIEAAAGMERGEYI